MQTVHISKVAIPSSKHLISSRADSYLTDIYRVYMFILHFLREVFSAPIEWEEIVNQCYQVGYKSLPLVSLTGFITGVVFTKQSRPSLSAFGAKSWLPSLVTIAIIRALAPLVTSLIASGKVGSNMGAELGSMKVTEQIDAMEVSATNPFKFLVVTRITAITLMMPILILYTGFVGMMGAYFRSHLDFCQNCLKIKKVADICFANHTKATFLCTTYSAKI